MSQSVYGGKQFDHRHLFDTEILIISECPSRLLLSDIPAQRPTADDSCHLSRKMLRRNQVVLT